MATYYVSSSGSNSNAGTSTGAAWKTISHVNSQSFNPGDTILFSGGQTFTGAPIQLGNSGTLGSPITIGSYGTGQATIQGTQTGVYLQDVSGFVIQNLIISGSSALNAGGYGICLYASVGTVYTGGMTVSNCTITGWGVGLSLGGSTAGCGYQNITIQNCTVNANRDYGLVTYGPSFNPASPYYVFTNFVTTGTTFSNHPGYASNTSSASGFGMVYGSVSGGTISDCVAFGNGSSNACTSIGPCGIMAYASTNVTISNCVAYSNHSGTVADGDGIDLDIYTTNSTVEYCIAYGNDAAGLLYFANTTANTNNVYRYNMVWGNCVGSHVSGYYGDIAVFGGSISSSAIYNNTVYSSSTYGMPIWISGTMSGVTFRNNILYQNGSPLYCIYLNTAAYTTSQVLFQGNDYYCPSGFSVNWHSATYNSLSSWQTGTSEEMIGATPTGYNVNPALVAATASPTTTSPSNLTGGNGLKLQSSSSIAKQGLNLNSNFGTNIGTQDYWGTVLSSPYSIGATQAGSNGSFFPLLPGG